MEFRLDSHKLIQFSPGHRPCIPLDFFSVSKEQDVRQAFNLKLQDIDILPLSFDEHFT